MSERATKESSAMQVFMDHAPAALAILDREMCYISATRRWRTDYGLGERDLRGQSHYEIFPNIPEYWKEVHRRAQAGEVLRADMERFERADGSVQWIRWEVRPWHDAAGNIGGIAIFTEDLTDIRRKEEALVISEQRLAAIIGAAVDAIISVDENQRVILFNASAEKIFGCSASEVIGESLDRFLPERFRTAHSNHIHAFGATGATSRSMYSAATIYGQRANGEEFPCEATISQAISGGQKIYTVILRDLTERKKVEQLRKLSGRLIEVRDQERQSVAYELHENLAQTLEAVAMYLLTAQKMGVAPNIKVERLLDDARSILQKNSSNIRSMAGVLYPGILDMLGLAAAIECHIRMCIDENPGMEISLDVPPDLARLSAKHELTLYRVVEEALANARCHSGSTTASVRLFHDASNVGIEVIDAGSGMQIRNESVAMDNIGAGRGILEMRERVSSLGGQIEIVSGHNGTTVRAIFPIVPREVDSQL